MSIPNYTTLKSTVEAFLNRTDLTQFIGTFVELAEAQMHRDIRHWKMEDSAVISLQGGQEFYSLPTDWVETKDIAYLADANAISKPLEYVSQATLDERLYNSNEEQGEPKYYSTSFAIEQPQISVMPVPPIDSSQLLLVRYLKKLPSLVDGNSTNWLLDYAPDIYLYGTLMHSAPYLKDDERLPLYTQMYNEAVRKLNDSSEQAENTYGRLKTRKTGLDTSRSRQPNHVRWS